MDRTDDRAPLLDLRIESLDHEAQGIARHEGKVVFVAGALPGETVRARVTRRKAQFDQAVAERVLRPGPSRVTPRCPHFGVCGGCNMQHADAAAQIAFKQRILEDNLERIGRVRPEVLLPTLQGPAWGYRQRARLSARWVAKKGGVLVGFHERHSSFVADMTRCEILPPAVSALLVPLRELVMALSIRDRLPQVEVALGDAVTVLVLRVLNPLTAEDETALRAFAERWQVQVWLQPKGPDSVFPFHPREAPELAYRLPEFGVVMPFGPTEFTQVNAAMNRSLVGRAVRLLDPQPGERVLDLFCGLGNFTLPLARSGAFVTGVEGSAALVARAGENAARNGLSDNTRFLAANLFEVTEEQLASWGPVDKLLIDPPRDGAVEVVKSLGGLLPRRIVYVSCSPATLARDAQILVHQQGYKLRAAGVVNMFPHTAHVESLALFERE
ncbi:MAG: 23S rRNA (uracil(1939)-C(5))-methyltransferase RlmD, partial [Betaproteobacteria bacterium]|nr:23S rRNA (uracil(1939)-C(5))-methyltransferase RlmD [Betaproteobacteria bacterium]MDE2132226.1 23S rRNA (uracil(1939)-C(5))-methyltransferase RlmD [Betaproteobacteria bacterium]MDE2211791.1 23S rRNA (uracil(1939)-C(5))-methyltransferase RlmD [Betaproteobacteria bacterium]